MTNEFLKFFNFLTSHNDVEITKFDGYQRIVMEQRLDDNVGVLEKFPTGDSDYVQPDFSQNIIGVNHLSGTGGSFLCQVLSISPDLSEQDYIDKICEQKNINSYRWMPYVDLWHSRIYRLHSDDVIITDISKFHKFVHISFDFTEPEIKMIQRRLKHIPNTRLTVHRGYAALICRLHKQLQNYLRIEYKKHFEFPFLAFYKQSYFVDTCNKMFEYCELQKPSEDSLIRVYNAWHKANIRHHMAAMQAFIEIDKLAHSEGVEPPTS